MWIAWLVAAAADPSSIYNSPTLGDQYETARSVGMGSAQRGIADQLDAIYVNPAGLAVKKQFLLGGNFGWQQDSKVYAPSVAVMDSATTSFAAGVAYGFERRDADAAGVMNINRVALSLAYNIGGYISVGLTAKYLQFWRDHPMRMPQNVLLNSPNIEPATGKAPFLSYGNSADVGANVVPTQFKSSDNFTGDLGLMIMPIKQITLGAVGYNLIPSCSDFSTKTGSVPQTCRNRELAPLGFGAGIAAHVLGLEADVDVVLDLWAVPHQWTAIVTPTDQMAYKALPRFNFGAEYTIVGMVPVRAGFIVDNVGGDDFWTIGAGFVIPQFGIDVGYRNAIERSANRTLTGSLRFSFN